MFRPTLTRVAATAAAVLSLAAVGRPADAAAAVYLPLGDECLLQRAPLSLVAGLAPLDRLGFTIVAANTSSGGYATLWDGSRSLIADDTWRGWGQLFVGATPSTATRYASGDAHGCSLTQGGKRLDFAQVPLSGVQVRRSIFVPGTGDTGSGVRIVDAITNPTASAATTSVWVGDLRNGATDGLGSDATTTLRSTSSGDVALTTADDWAVTTDARQNTLNDPSDPAISHVWNGPGGAVRATLIRGGAQASDKPVDNASGTLARQQFGWGWQNITVPANSTVRLLSWELLTSTDDRAYSTQAPAAKVAVEALTGGSLDTIYQGMTPAEIASVRNWKQPAVTGTLTAPAGATATTAVTLSATGVDFGSTVAGCATGTASWDFGDGTTSTGTTVSHIFAAAGTANVSLTLESACGGRLVRTVQLAITAPTPTPTVAPTPTPTPTATPTPTPTVAPTPTPTVAPTPTPTPTIAPTPTPTVAPTPTPTPTVAPATPTPTATPKPATPTPTATPKPATPTPTATPKPATPTATPAPVPTPPAYPTPDPASYPEPTPTPTPGADGDEPTVVLSTKLATSTPAPSIDQLAASDDDPVIPEILTLYVPTAKVRTGLLAWKGLTIGVKSAREGTLRLTLLAPKVKAGSTVKVKADSTTLVKLTVPPSSRKPLLPLKAIRLRAVLQTPGEPKAVSVTTLRLRR